VHLFAVVHREAGRYLMREVDGMWEFPTFPELPVGNFERVGSCRHTITHHHYRYSVRLAEWTGKLPARFAWKHRNKLDETLLTTATRKALQKC